MVRLAQPVLQWWGGVGVCGEVCQHSRKQNKNSSVLVPYVLFLNTFKAVFDDIKTFHKFLDTAITTKSFIL